MSCCVNVCVNGLFNVVLMTFRCVLCCVNVVFMLHAHVYCFACACLLLCMRMFTTLHAHVYYFACACLPHCMRMFTALHAHVYYSACPCLPHCMPIFTTCACWWLWAVVNDHFVLKSQCKWPNNTVVVLKSQWKVVSHSVPICGVSWVSRPAQCKLRPQLAKCRFLAKPHGVKYWIRNQVTTCKSGGHLQGVATQGDIPAPHQYRCWIFF